MREVVLGIDTSCYTTSVAAVDAQSAQVISAHRQLLQIPLGERGLRQSDGVFQHVRQLPRLMNLVSEDLRGCRICAVCVSRTPRDQDQSYMPVFQVGTSQGQSIAAVLGVPCYDSSHQRGHLYAARVNSRLPEGDALFLHLSGGTTELLQWSKGNLTLLGGTADLHAGQLVDRTAVAMGLSFPGGPLLEKLAIEGDCQHRLPVSFSSQNITCHLSGAETQVQRWIASAAYPPETIAREVFDFLARTVARLLHAGCQQTGISNALLAGGVASSELLRAMIIRRLQQLNPEMTVFFGHPKYSGDNAVGTALIGREHWLSDT